MAWGDHYVMSALTPDEARARLTAPGQPFEMTEIEIRGTRIRTWKHAADDYRALLEKSRSHGDRVFIVYEDEKITFEEHYRLAATLARRLSEEYGVAKGDRVAIAMRNFPEWIISFSAILACGAIAVPLNAWWTARELEFGLSDCGAKVLIADGERAAQLAGRPLPAHLVVNRGVPPAGATSLSALLAGAGPDVTPPSVQIAPEDPATILYTSGTTGHPKGSLGTHRNLGQVPLSIAYVITRARMMAGRDPDTKKNEVVLLTVPLFHATGCFATMIPCLSAGVTLVLMHQWDPGRALELIERERISCLVGVPTTAWQLLSHPDLAERDISSLHSIGYGGAPAPPRLLHRLTERLPGRAPSNGYGMTETTSMIINNAGRGYLKHPDSIGTPLPIIDVRICGPQGEELPTGEVGELCVRGPMVFAGYWNQPEATARTVVDGWLRTGDLARIDADGYIYIVDRATDMVIRGGENVYCAEVEAALFEHPAVDDAAIIGVPHEELGEEVGAVIRPVLGARVEPEELTAFLKGRIAPFKIPVHYWFSDKALPRNPGGKILKTQLRRDLLGSIS